MHHCKRRVCIFKEDIQNFIKGGSNETKEGMVRSVWNIKSFSNAAVNLTAVFYYLIDKGIAW